MIKKIFVALSMSAASGCNLAPVATVIVENSSDEVISDVELFSNGKSFGTRESLAPDASFSTRNITVRDKSITITYSRKGNTERRDIGYIPAYSRGHCKIVIMNSTFSRACRIG